MRRERAGGPGLRRLTRGQEAELLGAPEWIRAARRAGDVAAVVFFDSPEDRRRAWRLHAPRLLAEWSTPFRRPRSFWLDGRGEPVPPTHGAEIALLAGAGELTRSELAMLPDGLSPSQARDVALHPETPDDLRGRVLEHPGLLAGLTPAGVDAFLDALPRGARAIVGD